MRPTLEFNIWYTGTAVRSNFQKVAGFLSVSLRPTSSKIAISNIFLQISELHSLFMSLKVCPARHHGFETLTDRIHVSKASNSKSSELVIICTWLGALPKHIAKYTQLYREIAPGADILLIESDVSAIISSYGYQQRIIQPAVLVLLETLANDSNPKILLHTFSNGGPNTATQLFLVARRSHNSPIPIAGIVFDSGPARERYEKNVAAMVVSLPKNLVARVFGSIVCHGLMLILHTWIYLGNESPADLQRRTLLDTRIIGPMNNATKFVCYLFSKSDRLCVWTDVQDHAEDARGLGCRVEEILFDGSGHCAHFSKDPDVYSAAVSRAWEGGGCGIGDGGVIGKNSSKL